MAPIIDIMLLLGILVVMTQGSALAPFIYTLFQRLPKPMIRDIQPGDWPAIWPIFKKVVRAGDTYGCPADTYKPTSEALWITKPERTFVFERDGKILGTYYLKTNHKGPGKHVCNCGYMV